MTERKHRAKAKGEDLTDYAYHEWQDECDLWEAQ